MADEDIKNREDALVWRKRALGLWQLLDDISTAGDQHKPVIGPYFRHVHIILEKRSDHLISDGYNLFAPEDMSMDHPLDSD